MQHLLHCRMILFCESSFSTSTVGFCHRHISEPPLLLWGEQTKAVPCQGSEFVVLIPPAEAQNPTGGNKGFGSTVTWRWRHRGEVMFPGCCLSYGKKLVLQCERTHKKVWASTSRVDKCIHPLTSAHFSQYCQGLDWLKVKLLRNAW